MVRTRVSALSWKLMVRLAPEPWFITVMRTAMVPADRFLLARTKGRFSVGGTTGAGTLLLTTTGRRTGQPRSTPLFYKPHGDTFAVVASNFGRRNHPAWSTNLLATPHATVTVGNRVVPVTARLLAGEEHDEVWRYFTSFGPAYQNYLDTSGRNVFRVFALDRTESGGTSGA
ncbi:nitroreductase family deazaflavin-dependent oxidoreductase [Streptomyces sp. TRM 70361]|uniref:nitroreductase family deazaflavin-dependent oxidoreductase n=1 Tax=Streptomyces sp. TRM 70361 TaxID=3116553 RepID=UPI002E7B96C2|nr:nitroreductase family deazaflavin-dependent oxidoreductase [Streptomyces sp. TRM 70361]MEE1939103.1 nitroreductase family deazaflavin-dependent oxidoreductase [Streptomyces sp. TRM 70361]